MATNTSNAATILGWNLIWKVIISIDLICRERELIVPILGLRYDLEKHLFGQHIAKEMIPSAIKASRSKVGPSKPLVLSFHGWPGNGKNYVASFIAKNYFQHGSDSNYFHLFSGRKDFGVERDVDVYKVNFSLFYLR